MKCPGLVRGCFYALGFCLFVWVCLKAFSSTRSATQNHLTDQYIRESIVTKIVQAMYMSLDPYKSNFKPMLV